MAGRERIFAALIVFLAAGTYPEPAGAEDPWEPRPWDTEPPNVGLVIRDPTNGWRETSSLVEGRTYAFDASSTTDDSLLLPEDNGNLTYAWNFGDGTVLGPGTGGPPDGLLNVTHAYAEYGEFGLNLTAWDAAGNPGNLFVTIIVQADPQQRPNLAIAFSFLTFSPESPYEGQETHVRVDIRNLGLSVSRQLRVALAIIEAGRVLNQTLARVQLLDEQGRPRAELGPNETATLEFFWTPTRPGAYTVRIRASDVEEPTPWITYANEVSRFVTVRVDYPGRSLRLTLFVLIETGASVAIVLAALRRHGRWRHAVGMPRKVA